MKQNKQLSKITNEAAVIVSVLWVGLYLYIGSGSSRQELGVKNDVDTMKMLDPIQQVANSAGVGGAGWPAADLQEYAEAASSLAHYRLAAAGQHLKNDERIIDQVTKPPYLVSQRLSLLAALKCGSEDYGGALNTASAAAKLGAASSAATTATARPLGRDRDPAPGLFDRAKSLNNLGVIEFIKAEDSDDPAVRTKLFSQAADYLAMGKTSIQHVPDPADRQLLERVASDNSLSLSNQQRLGD